MIDALSPVIIGDKGLVGFRQQEIKLILCM